VDISHPLVPILQREKFPNHFTLSFRENSRLDSQDGQTGPRDPIAEYRKDYLALGPEFHTDMNLMDICLIRYRNRPKEA
jgi:hypothetical protein